MSLSRANFDDIAEGDLDNQIQSGVPEGIYFDYKRDAYGATEGDKREFLKDISSFANASGGHLVIGIDEAGGIARSTQQLNRSSRMLAPYGSNRVG